MLPSTRGRGLGVRAVGVVEVAPAEDLDAYHLEELRLDRRPVCDEGAVVCRRLEPVDVELARARAERVQVQVADGADRLDAGERAEAIQQAPRVDARLVALALLTAGRELDPDLWVLETKTMDRHLALMRLPQQLSAFAYFPRPGGSTTGTTDEARRQTRPRSSRDTPLPKQWVSHSCRAPPPTEAGIPRAHTR